MCESGRKGMKVDEIGQKINADTYMKHIATITLVIILSSHVSVHLV